MKKIIYILIHFLTIIYAWDADEMEIFDLVEEIDKNFYDILGLKQDSTPQEIKKAFRSLSILVHPDKNKAEDANVQFRNIVAVYEVLKDPSKREKYDKVLREGLPNWKSALYYYRRAKKLGLAEGALIIFIVFTIGQYLYAWASFLEKKYTLEQILESKLKKIPKKKKNETIDLLFEDIPSPSIYNTLPFQIIYLIWNLPFIIKTASNHYSEIWIEEIKKRKKEKDDAKLCDIQKAQLQEEKLKLKEIRKRKIIEKPPEKSDAELVGYSQLKTKEWQENVNVNINSNEKITGGIWTDDDITQLVYLTKKYSVGVQRRWEIISDIMGRSTSEVTFMATKLKENSYRVLSQFENESINSLPKDEDKKIETIENGNILVPQKNWSQIQQKALEEAIILYKNLQQTEKWVKIAEHVPQKSKEECQLRYKYLCQLIKTNKSSKVINNDNKDVEMENEIENLEHRNEMLDEGCEQIAKQESGGKKKNLRKQRKKEDAELVVDNYTSL